MIKGLSLKYTEEDIQKAYKQGIENGKYEVKKEFEMYNIAVREENKESLQKQYNKGFEKGSDYVREYAKQNDLLQNNREEEIQKLSFNDGYQAGKKEGYDFGYTDCSQKLYSIFGERELEIEKESYQEGYAQAYSELHAPTTERERQLQEKAWDEGYLQGESDMLETLNELSRQQTEDWNNIETCDEQLEKELALVEKYPHYYKDIRHLNILDIYRFFDLFEVTDPCLQHSLKKMAVGGKRGSKDYEKDIKEAMDTLSRWEYMQEENKRGMND